MNGSSLPQRHSGQVRCNMAIPGKRFDLNLDSEDWAFDVHDDDNQQQHDPHIPSVVDDIHERNTDTIPPAPTLKTTKTGFPEHRPRKFDSSFKQQRLKAVKPPGPSDAAIVSHIAKKNGYNIDQAREKQTIESENEDRLAHMTTEDIEQARDELMAQLDPAILRKFMQRATIDNVNDEQTRMIDEYESRQPKKKIAFAPIQKQNGENEGEEQEIQSEDDDESHPYINPIPRSLPDIHFPAPPRRAEDLPLLDPDSDTFLTDLRTHYFPDLPHDPSTLAWLQTPHPDENTAYSPLNTHYKPSDLRFDFAGSLLTPRQASQIPASMGLHHHGDAPSVAGYTIPELGLLARSTLPNQRCIAYQVLGRILFRLGRGDFTLQPDPENKADTNTNTNIKSKPPSEKRNKEKTKNSSLQDSLWTCIEQDRILETIMTEANRDGPGTHLSARAYATEALWLWRRGGGGEGDGERGVLREKKAV